MLWIAVALGGSLGALARYAVAQALAGQALKLPVATFTVNLLGSFLMGAFYVLIIEKSLLPEAWRQLVMVGFLGALTTFSTFSIEVVQQLQQGLYTTAITYVMASILCCTLAVVAGAALIKTLF